MNIWKGFAHLFDLELNEEFKLKAYNTLFRFTFDGLQQKGVGKEDWKMAEKSTEWELLHGITEIKKILGNLLWANLILE